MKYPARAVAVASLLMMTGSAAIAQKHAHAKPVIHHKVANALICPVTGTKIASVDKAVGHSTYKGKTYYFCCSECKPRFDKNPGAIVKNAAKGKYEKM